MSDTKISVVIPAYNEEKYLGSCLESLGKQSLPPAEVIVVDNNSTDRTASIAQNFDVRVVKEDKQGITYARNRGYNATKHELISRCDADTIVPEDWLEKIVSNFAKYDIDALTGIAYFYDIKLNNKIDTTRYHKFSLDSVKLFLKGRETLLGFNMALTQEIWQKVKDEVCLGDEDVHEDLDLALHIHKAGGVIRRDESLLVGTSARRLKNNPLSALGEYPFRGLKMLISHVDDIYLKQ